MGLESEKRKDAILRLLQENPQVTISELADAFSVSKVTIRRDTASLARAGKLLRTYGGAVSSPKLLCEFTFTEKLEKNIQEKQAVGRQAAALIDDGDTVLMDTGTTTLQIAKSLPPGLKATVITASLPIVSALSRSPDIKIVLLGGEFHVDGFDLAGPITERQLEGIHVDKSFQGADGIDLQQGLATSDFRLSRIAELMMKAAKEVIIVADHTKFGKKSLAPFGRVENADIIITSKGVSRRLMRSLRRRGIRVLVAKTKGARA